MSKEHAEETDRISLPELWSPGKRGYINDPDTLDLGFYQTAFGAVSRRRDNRETPNRLADVGNLTIDIEEIEARQKIFRAVLNDQSAAKEIADLYVFDDIPAGYDGLRRYLENGTFFYDAIRKGIKNLACLRGPGSERLADAEKKLGEFLELEDEERSLLEAMSEEARKCHKFVGNLSIVFYHYGRFDVYHSEAYGFRTYPINPEDHEPVSSTPDHIEEDIIRYIKGKFKVERDYDRETELSKKVFGDFDHVGLSIDYMYCSGGLKLNVRLDRHRTQLNEKSRRKEREIADFVKREFRKQQYMPPESASRLGRWVQRRRTHGVAQAEVRLRERFVRRAEYNARENILIEHEPRIGELSGCVPSPATDRIFQGAVIEAILSKNSRELSKYRKARRELESFVSGFQEYYEAAAGLIQMESNGYPLAFPKILPASEKIMRIKQLYPVRLAARTRRKEDIVPNDVECNGKPNVITGPNAEGKSIYIISINDAILMAQAGMPVLAESAEMSVKDALLLHFVKNGDAEIGQSTFQNAMERFKQLFSQIPDYQSPHITSDELAAGTDPQSACDVSARITRALSGIASRASSYVVTQFRAVAEMAQEQHSANALKADKFRIMPGIGDAKGLELAERIGLTDEFIDDIIARCTGGNGGGK